MISATYKLDNIVEAMENAKSKEAVKVVVTN
jgi:hypothetical protein